MVAVKEALEIDGDRTTFKPMKKMPDKLGGKAAAEIASGAWKATAEARRKKGLANYGFKDGVIVRILPDGTMEEVTGGDLDAARRLLSGTRPASAVSEHKKIA